MGNNQKIQKVHNEYFQPIAKRTCPCGRKKTQIFSWGEYVAGKFRKIDHFCQDCFSYRVIPRLVNHAEECGCSFRIQPRSGHIIPSWIDETFQKYSQKQFCQKAS